MQRYRRQRSAICADCNGDFPLTGRASSWTASRSGSRPGAALDQVLIDAAIEADAKFRDGFGVHDLTSDDDRVNGVRGRGGLTEQARFVIGEAGACREQPGEGQLAGQPVPR